MTEAERDPLKPPNTPSSCSDCLVVRISRIPPEPLLALAVMFAEMFAEMEFAWMRVMPSRHAMPPEVGIEMMPYGLECFRFARSLQLYYLVLSENLLYP